MIKESCVHLKEDKHMFYVNVRYDFDSKSLSRSGNNLKINLIHSQKKNGIHERHTFRISKCKL